jgi:hypothetical protein
LIYYTLQWIGTLPLSFSCLAIFHCTDLLIGVIKKTAGLSRNSTYVISGVERKLQVTSNQKTDHPGQYTDHGAKNNCQIKFIISTLKTRSATRRIINGAMNIKPFFEILVVRGGKLGR